MSKKLNLNELFEKIDNELIERRVPIAHRFLEATTEISNIFNVAILLYPKGKIDNGSLEYYLSSCLDSWYTAKYGDKRKLNMDLGAFYIIIKQELWKYRVPRFFGTCNFFIGTDLSDKGENHETNILKMCKDMTQFYVNTLDNNELIYIFNEYKKAINIFQIFNGWREEDVAMLEAIYADMNNISVQLDNTFPHYGQALFSYLQVGEKIIKSWLLKSELTLKDLKEKYGHRIDKLAKAFNDRYVEQLEINIINGLINNPNLRYGKENDFDIKDIIKAQEAVFHIILRIGFSPKIKNNND
ncbi:hypothetical protein I6J48_17950 [Acinetobacter calcoaceticus]|uniref:hypothetical protein n=1 Tax=Acinetobacter calcoaceticus TaxID=471 RepID=UPI0019682071|nr:hypothetical protein [Acinetobacter calcoaceticus]QSB54035.1 hypothetical protein I6J48_17950 [Acinetobacter calcoaceticus]